MGLMLCNSWAQTLRRGRRKTRKRHEVTQRQVPGLLPNVKGIGARSLQIHKGKHNCQQFVSANVYHLVAARIKKNVILRVLCSSFPLIRPNGENGIVYEFIQRVKWVVIQLYWVII